jgi:hypothetical protein
MKRRQSRPKRVAKKAADPIAAARRRLNRWLAAYERRWRDSGDNYWLLAAIDVCLATRTPVPPVFAQEFCDRFLSWASWQEPSLDVAFLTTRPRLHFAQRKKREQLTPLVAMQVERLRQQGKPIDVALTETADKFAISISTASRIFYAAPDWLRLLLRKSQISN